MLFSQDIGIDLGTSNTSIFAKGKGIVIREPSVVAISVGSKSSKVVAVGNSAKEMIGRTPGSISAMKPIKNGVIADFDIASEMLKKFISKALGGSYFAKARVVICVPSGVTEVERRNMHDVAIEAGAKYVSLIEEPLAAAIGAGLPVTKPQGSMIVDIGGGTTEVAVVSLGDIVTYKAVRVGGDNFDSSISQYIKRKYNLLVGERTAEEIKIKIGSAEEYEGEGKMEIRGRNLVDGLPLNITITSEEIREAISDDVASILEVVKATLEKTPPELSADIMNLGITLSGGSALLRGMDTLISRETGMPVHIAENPLDCALQGTGIFIEKDILGKVGKKL